MDTKAMMEQARNDPTGNRFTQCPKCEAWRGVGMGVCAKCGKPIPKVIAYEEADGTVATAQRKFCDECAAELRGAEPENEEAHEE
ncbi:MAG: hypothetical protein JW889_06440 [Verrucomicrobia bacterium]|nr:hypothetical protein [Verrucomicrobiota bacterium]